MHVLVMAKAPVPGRVKTRLCPPCTPQQAADVAEAALHDTLTAALASGADRCVLALDGRPGPWLPPGVDVVPQGDGSFGTRLDRAWARAGGPGVQIGMDTPQVTPSHLDDAMGRLASGARCLLGPANDGGWWAIALADPPPSLFAPVPMSRNDTCARQRDRCRQLGLMVEDLPELVDVDTIDDARLVAASAPATRFAKVLDGIGAVAVPASGMRDGAS